MDRELFKDYLLTRFPNPERDGCPDEDMVKALAKREIPLDHPAMMHIARCAECFSEYLNHRQDLRESKEKS